MKWNPILLATACLSAMLLAFSLTACGSSGEPASEAPAPIVSEAPAPEAKEPDSLPFTLPEGFAYDLSYSTGETALFHNGRIAITYGRTDSSSSYLLSAQNNTATQDTTLSAVQAGRPELTDLEISDFSYDKGDDYIRYSYTLTFTNRNVAEINYIYTYTNNTYNYAVSVNAAQSDAEQARAIADGIAQSFRAE